MVRFIFICMGVVAVSILSIAGQGIFEGIKSAQQEIAARNAVSTDTPTQAPQENVETAVVTEPTAEELNTILPAAGEFDDNDRFKGGFTNVAPKALADAPAPVVPTSEPVATDEKSAN